MPQAPSPDFTTTPPPAPAPTARAEGTGFMAGARYYIRRRGDRCDSMVSAPTERRTSHGARTREAIVDAAELVFGAAPYDSVAIRQIAKAADVPLGLVGYYFKTKLELFEAVAARRADDLNAERLALLQQLGDPSVEQIMQAFIGPVFEHVDEEQWQAYIRAIGQVSHEPRFAELNDRLFHPTLLVFYEALRRALPACPPERLARGLIHVRSMLIGELEHGTRFRTLPGGKSPDGGDVDTAVTSLVQFASAGLRGTVDT